MQAKLHTAFLTLGLRPRPRYHTTYIPACIRLILTLRSKRQTLTRVDKCQTLTRVDKCQTLTRVDLSNNPHRHPK